MHPLFEKSVAYLRDHWDVGLDLSTAEAARQMGMSHNTLKSRLTRDQAVCLRDMDGRQRAAIDFTGRALVFNVLIDRLLRYGVPYANEESGSVHIAHTYSEWVRDNVLSPPFNSDMIIRIDRDEDGTVRHHFFEDGNVGDWTGDAALIIPIATMVLRMAASLAMRGQNGVRLMDEINRKRAES